MWRCQLSQRRSVLGPGQRAFSLMELVVVVVVIGIVAAIAIPRLNSGSASAGESALAGNLALLRTAIEYYRTEHNVYPTCNDLPDNQTTIMLQLTQYTDAAGNVSSTRSAMYQYGPYLKSIPPLTVTTLRKGFNKIGTADGPNVGWLYDPASGEIVPNTDGIKEKAGNRLYNDY